MIKREHKYDLTQTSSARQKTRIDLYNRSVKQNRINDGLPENYNEDERRELNFPPDVFPKAETETKPEVETVFEKDAENSESLRKETEEKEKQNQNQNQNPKPKPETKTKTKTKTKKTK